MTELCIGGDDQHPVSGRSMAAVLLAILDRAAYLVFLIRSIH